ALRTERKRRGWTQAKVAEALRVSTKTVVRWENGYAAPFPYYRQKLSTLFGKTVQELGLLWNADEMTCKKLPCLLYAPIHPVLSKMSGFSREMTAFQRCPVFRARCPVFPLKYGYTLGIFIMGFSRHV
ncbi:MAG TPA: helix-turn-helix transcriptional regulator, partial [Ktedonobacteraceae bacterium]